MMLVVITSRSARHSYIITQNDGIVKCGGAIILQRAGKRDKKEATAKKRLLRLFLCRSDHVKENENTKNNADKAVKSHKRADDSEDNTNDRNAGKDADKHAYDSSDNEEDNKLNKEGNNVTSGNLKGSRPKSSQEIHYNSPFIDIIFISLRNDDQISMAAQATTLRIRFYHIFFTFSIVWGKINCVL